MGSFGFWKRPDLERGLKTFRETPGAVLLDVRTPQEYGEGHLPGSVNAPLQTLGEADALPASRDTPIFVYCHSGARSAQAARLLARMGYLHVQNIGGIAYWKGGALE